MPCKEFQKQWQKGGIVVLLPLSSLPFYRKLLKMHEAKYEPMDKVRAQIEINIFSIFFLIIINFAPGGCGEDHGRDPGDEGRSQP